MILYHVSTNLKHDGAFAPRIPASAFYGDGEDKTIPRICFSESIEGCLSSMPEGGAGLYSYIYKFNNVFKLFILDTEKYQNLEILGPDQISDKVCDAKLYKEYWVLNPIKIEDFVFIKIENFEYDHDSKSIYNLRYEILKDLDPIYKFLLEM